MSENEPISVVTWKWDNGIHPKKGIKFTADHINRFFKMLKRNTTVPFRPFCITDNWDGIDEDINVIPLWDDYRDMGGCYVRLFAFSEEVKTVLGDKFIWFDIDSVIVGNMDAILTDKADFKAWGDTHPRTPYNGSMIMMKTGARKQVWEDFHPLRSPSLGKRMGHVGTDQAWIGACLGKYEPKWNTDDGVYSYRVHLKRSPNPAILPENAKIVFFHGSSDPSKAEMQKLCPWIKEHWQ